MTDLPIVALMIGKRGPKSVAHVMVKSSDDAFIDADGLHPLVEIIDQAGVDASDQTGWEVREISPKELVNWLNGKRLPLMIKSEVPAAKAQAQEVLARLGIPSR